MFRQISYNDLTEAYKELQAKYYSNKKECEEIKTELEETKQNKIRLSKYINQLKIELDDIKGKCDTLAKDNIDLLDWNEGCKEEYNKFKRTADESKKAVFAIKELLGKDQSDWLLGPEIAWRFNKETHKIEKYKIPKKFNESDVEDFDFDDNLTMCSFKHPDKSYNFKEYTIPPSLYSCIGGKTFINQTGRTIFYDFGLFKNQRDLKNYIISKGGSINGMYWNKVLSFILSHQDETFSTKEVLDYCKFANRESCRQHLNKLIKWKIIQKVSIGIFESVSM